MPKDESVTFEIGNRFVVVPVANIISRMRDDFEDRYGTVRDDSIARECDPEDDLDDERYQP